MQKSPSQQSDVYSLSLKYPVTRPFTFSPPPIDINSTVSKIWPQDNECSRFKVTFGLNIEPTYLVSFPRSGNTWTRYLVEGATGIFTGSVYNDEGLYKMGYKGELEPFKSGRTLLIKTHTQAFMHSPFVVLQGTSFVILLIRNPADAITSYWNFKGARKVLKSPHTFIRDELSYKKKEFRQFVQEHVDIWSQICESVLIWTRHLLVVFYEEIVQDPIKQVKRIINFLEVPEDEERMKCVAKHIRGPAKRDHEPIDPLSKMEKKLISHAMSTVISLLHLRGITPPESYLEWIAPFKPQLNFSSSRLNSKNYTDGVWEEETR